MLVTACHYLNNLEQLFNEKDVSNALQTILTYKYNDRVTNELTCKTVQITGYYTIYVSIGSIMFEVIISCSCTVYICAFIISMLLSISIASVTFMLLNIHLDHLSVSQLVGLYAKCIVAKWLIGSGCRLGW